MHTKKRTTKSAVLEPDYQSPQWMYDTLMQEIEPDLTSANITKLDEMYKDETQEEKAIRYERYNLAFITLGECIQDLKDEMVFDALSLTAVMDAMVAEEEKDGKEIKIDEIEEQIDNTDFRA